MSCPENKASVLKDWIPMDEKRGSISLHTADGKVCRAKGDYSESLAMLLARGEIKRHPEGVLVQVEGGFRLFPMSNVSYIAFTEFGALAGPQVHDALGG